MPLKDSEADATYGPKLSGQVEVFAQSETSEQLGLLIWKREIQQSV